jgi:TonB family protein
METFALYLLKSVIWLVGFALVFILFLRNERFFLLNRIYLLAGILTSFLFPLISIHYTVILPVVGNFQSDSAVVSEIQNAGSSIIPDLKLLLLVLYVSGVLFVFTLMIKQGRSVFRAIKKSEIISFHPAKLIKTSDYTSVFSFFSYVFVNPSITDIETKEIMNHELVHIRQKHWFDLLLVQLLCMMQWFNPLVWIYIRFIRQNHEYLADEVALQQTSDPAIYRAVLLNQIVGAPVVSLANSFNYSPNKKRFNMMKNIISSPYRKMKILLILPVFAIVLYAFAKPDYKYKYADQSSGNISSGTFLQQKSVKGTVVQQDGESLPGANIVIRGTTMGTAADAKGYFKLDNVTADGNLVVSFIGFKTKILKPDFSSDMTIKMTRDTVKYSGIEELAPTAPDKPVAPVNNIKEINVVPPPPDSPTPPPSLSDGPPPLYVIDGIIVTKAEADKISPETIASVYVLKDKITTKPATEKYGEKGKEGVVEIITKNAMDKILVVIDGVIHEKDGMSSISQEDIEMMSVLTPESATNKYGEKGKNGAIEVITFKTGEKRPDGTIVAVTPGDPKTGNEQMEVVQSISKPGNEAFVVVEEMPEFPGGTDAMIAWITSNLKYPAEALKSKITGKVYVNFAVSSKGKVKNVVVSKSANPLLNAEAIRVISSMPDWKPGTQGGKSVEVQIKVPVEFKLK